MKKILGKHSMVVLVVIFFFVSIAAFGWIYYLNTHQPTADTVVSKNTSCILNIVDNITGAPIVGAAALFRYAPVGATVYSDRKGCVKFPDQFGAVANGDYFQIDVLAPNYQQQLVNMSVSTSMIVGKSKKTVKLGKNTTATSVNTAPTANGSKTSKILDLVDKAEAANPSKMLIVVYDATAVGSDEFDDTHTGAKIISGASVELHGDNNAILGKCTTDENGECNITSNVLFHQKQIEVVTTKQNYLVDYSKETITSSGGTPGWLDKLIYLWPDNKQRQIHSFTGSSQAKTCQGSYEFKTIWVAPASAIDKALWDEQTIQEVANNLATEICALKQSNNGPKYIPIPKIYIINSSQWLGAYSQHGDSSIMIGASEEMCIGINENVLNACRINVDNKVWRFAMPTFTYGLILDGAGSAVGRFSSKANWMNLFKLMAFDKERGSASIKSLFKGCTAEDSPYISGFSIFSECAYQIATSPEAYWARSFTDWMGYSLAGDLKLDVDKVKQKTSFMNEVPSAGPATNYRDFLNKRVVDEIGSFCHPTFMDDNGRKTGMTYAGPPWDLKNMIIGGPLGRTYTTDEILSGIATHANQTSGKGFIKVTFKKLPLNYVPKGITIGVAPSCKIDKGADSRTCSYGPFSARAIDTSPGLKTSDQVSYIPLAGFTKYNINATSFCSGQTEQQAKVGKRLLSDQILNTENNSNAVTVDFNADPFVGACKTTTTPNQPPGGMTSPTGAR